MSDFNNNQDDLSREGGGGILKRPKAYSQSGSRFVPAREMILTDEDARLSSDHMIDYNNYNQGYYYDNIQQEQQFDGSQHPFNNNSGGAYYMGATPQQSNMMNMMNYGNGSNVPVSATDAGAQEPWSSSYQQQESTATTRSRSNTIQYNSSNTQPLVSPDSSSFPLNRSKSTSSRSGNNRLSVASGMAVKDTSKAMAFESLLTESDMTVKMSSTPVRLKGMGMSNSSNNYQPYLGVQKNVTSPTSKGPPPQTPPKPKIKYQAKDAVAERSDGAANLAEFLRHTSPDDPMGKRASSTNNIPHHVMGNPHRGSVMSKTSYRSNEVDTLPRSSFSEGDLDTLSTFSAAPSSVTANMSGLGTPPSTPGRHPKAPSAKNQEDDDDEFLDDLDDYFHPKPKKAQDKEMSLAEFLRTSEPPPAPASPPTSRRSESQRSKSFKLFSRGRSAGNVNEEQQSSSKPNNKSGSSSSVGNNHSDTASLAPSTKSRSSSVARGRWFGSKSASNPTFDDADPMPMMMNPMPTQQQQAQMAMPVAPPVSVSTNAYNNNTQSDYMPSISPSVITISGSPLMSVPSSPVPRLPSNPTTPVVVQAPQLQPQLQQMMPPPQQQYQQYQQQQQQQQYPQQQFAVLDSSAEPIVRSGTPTSIRSLHITAMPPKMPTTNAPPYTAPSSAPSTPPTSATQGNPPALVSPTRRPSGLHSFQQQQALVSPPRSRSATPRIPSSYSGIASITSTTGNSSTTSNNNGGYPTTQTSSASIHSNSSVVHSPVRKMATIVTPDAVLTEVLNRLRASKTASALADAWDVYEVPPARLTPGSSSSIQRLQRESATQTYWDHEGVIVRVASSSQTEEYTRWARIDPALLREAETQTFDPFRAEFGDDQSLEVLEGAYEDEDGHLVYGGLVIVGEEVVFDDLEEELMAAYDRPVSLLPPPQQYPQDEEEEDQDDEVEVIAEEVVDEVVDQVLSQPNPVPESVQTAKEIVDQVVARALQSARNFPAINTSTSSASAEPPMETIPAYALRPRGSLPHLSIPAPLKARLQDRRLSLGLLVRRPNSSMSSHTIPTSPLNPTPIRLFSPTTRNPPGHLEVGLQVSTASAAPTEIDSTRATPRLPEFSVHEVAVQTEVQEEVQQASAVVKTILDTATQSDIDWEATQNKETQASGGVLSILEASAADALNELEALKRQLAVLQRERDEWKTEVELAVAGRKAAEDRAEAVLMAAYTIIMDSVEHNAW